MRLIYPLIFLLTSCAGNPIPYLFATSEKHELTEKGKLVKEISQDDLTTKKCKLISVLKDKLEAPLGGPRREKKESPQNYQKALQVRHNELIIRLKNAASTLNANVISSIRIIDDTYSSWDWTKKAEAVALECEISS